MPGLKITAVIPAYNEEGQIAGVIREVKKYVQDVVIVDDGSFDKTFEVSRKEGAKVFRHMINLGLGGALGTGIIAALREGADIILTLDADGQHEPGEIPKVAEPIIKNEADIVIGSRFLTKQKMPLFRRWGNYFFNLITFFLFGAWSTDSQSGFRAFNRKAAESLEFYAIGMEVSSQILKEAKMRKLKIKEVPIKSIYTDYSLSKGQGFFTGLKTLFKLFLIKLLR